MDDAHATGRHISVLLDESVDALHLRPGSVCVDGTFGRGGHSRAILERLGAQGRLLAFDKDPAAVEQAAQIHDPRFEIIHGSFVGLAQALRERGIATVDAVLLDLGVSSPQLDQAERGFSFRVDGPLDMRMDTTRGLSAGEFVNTGSEQHLAQVIRDYGEERFAVQVAKAIVARRAERGFERTLDLAQVVAGAVKTREKGQDPATRTFQALRIHVNQELEELPLVLDQAARHLAPAGRLVVISFHSLEDRIVKQFMQRNSRVHERFARMPLRESELPQPLFAGVARVLASPAEIAANPRARSAVMRCASRTGAPCPVGTL